MITRAYVYHMFLPTSFVCCESLCVCVSPCVCVFTRFCARPYAYVCVRTFAIRLFAFACIRVCPNACVHVPLANLPSCVSSLLVGVSACDVCLCILRVAHPAHILRKCICVVLQVLSQSKSCCELARWRVLRCLISQKYDATRRYL